jgi:hypothetical protein
MVGGGRGGKEKLRLYYAGKLRCTRGYTNASKKREANAPMYYLCVNAGASDSDKLLFINGNPAKYEETGIAVFAQSSRYTRYRSNCEFVSDDENVCLEWKNNVVSTMTLTHKLMCELDHDKEGTRELTLQQSKVNHAARQALLHDAEERADKAAGSGLTDAQCIIKALDDSLVREGTAICTELFVDYEWRPEAIAGEHLDWKFWEAYGQPWWWPEGQEWETVRKRVRRIRESVRTIDTVKLTADEQEFVKKRALEQYELVMRELKGDEAKFSTIQKLAQTINQEGLLTMLNLVEMQAEQQRDDEKEFGPRLNTLMKCASIFDDNK